MERKTIMRAWVIHEYSGYKGLSLEEFEKQQPGPGEVRLRIEAFALNWGDMNLMRDMYSFSFREFPALVGIEAAGIVDAVGEGVQDIEIGRRYCTLPYFYYNHGTSAESAVVDARYITPAPAGLSAVESAAIWMQYMTAYFPIVEIARAGPGTNILVPAATSTAGSAAVEIARMHDANVFATSRFDYNRTFLRELGADHVFVDDGGDLAAFLHEATHQNGINVAFDPVGADLLKRYSRALAKNARVFVYGFLDKVFPELPFRDMFQANALLHPYSLCNYVEDAEMCPRGKAFVYKALAEGKIAPRIDRVYPMEDYRNAWEYVRKPRENHGKVVIRTGVS